MNTNSGGDEKVPISIHSVEDDLFELENYINDMWEFLPIPVVYLSPKGVVLDLNKKFEELCGCTKDDAIGTLISDLCPVFHEQHYSELLTTGKQWRRQESTLKRCDESKIPVSIYAYARIDEHKNVIGCFAAFIDITERKQQEARLVQSAAEYRTALNSMIDAIHVIDTNYHIIMFNETFRKWNQELGLPIDAVGKNLFEIFPFLPDRVKEEYRHVFETGKILFTEETTKVGNREFVTDTRKIPIIEEGKVARIVTEIRDITQSKLMQTTLKNSEERFRIAATCVSDLIWDWDIPSGKLEWFGKIDELLGYAPGEFPRTIKAWEEVIHPSDHDRVMMLLEKHLSERAVYDTEYRVVRKDGSIRYWTDRGLAFWDDKNAAYRMIGACTDITDRKSAEQRIIVANERLKYLLSTTSAIIYSSKAEGDYGATFISENVTQMLGYSPHEFTDTTSFWIEHVHPDDRDRVMKEMQYLFDIGVYAFEFRFMRKDGVYVWVRDEMRLVRDGLGAPVEIVGFLTDIAERKTAEEAVIKSEKKYHQLIELTHEGVWVIDADSKTTFVNPQMAMMLCYEPEEMIGKSLFDFMDEKSVEIAKRNVERRKRGISEQHDFEFLRKDGSKISTLLETGAMIAEDGTYQGAVAMVADISDRVRAERTLRHHLEFEKIVTTISTHFISIVPEEIDHAIDNALMTIGQFAGAGRAYVFQFSADGNTMSNTHEWCAEHVEPQMHRLQNIPVEPFSWSINQLKQLKTINVPRVADMPKEAQTEKDEFDSEMIKSVVLVPMVFGGSLIGFVGFDAVIEERVWSEETITILRVVGEIFSSTLEHKFVFEALRESEDKFRSLADQSPNMIFINSGGKVVYANSRCSEIMGYSRDEFYAPDFDFMVLVATEYIDLIKENLAKHFRGEELGNYDYTLITRDNSRIDVMLSSKLINYGGKPAILGILTDITSRKTAERDQALNIERLKKVLDGTVNALAAAAEKKDPYTAGHQRRVTRLAVAIAREMNLDENQIEGIKVGGTLHDIGKIYVPTEILSKPTTLTSVEYSIVKTHPKIGSEILKNIEFPWPIAEMVVQHHERLNGSGYPDGIKGVSIILEARILTVADVVEAMSSHRPYRPAKGITMALEEIKANRGVLYDEQAADACIKLFQEKDFKFE